MMSVVLMHVSRCLVYRCTTCLPSTVFGAFDMDEYWTKECNGAKVARQRTGLKSDQTTGSRRI